ncbi:MAG TPA: hypothetical protein VMM13_03040 [Euzebya sp.]|nr:hypothetical protein [Euzebya sp.]
MATDRTDLWLPLLRELTETYPGWSVWKNVRSAFAGTGDVDSFAPPSDWPAIQQTFIDWAGHSGLGPVLICRHIPQGPHFITFEDGSPYIVQLDVKERGTFRGSTLIDAWSLLPLSQVREEGFRGVRPGAEGVIKLCLNGVRKGGHANHEALREKRVAELLESDPEGVSAAAQLLGPARRALLRGAAAVVDGEWDRRAMLTVEAWSAARGLTEPRVAASRWWFLNVTAKRCGVVDLIREHDRRIDGDLEPWLDTVADSHTILRA